MRFERIGARLRSTAAAACLGASALAVPLSSHAVLVTSVSGSFSGSLSVTDAEGGGSTSNNGNTLATTTLQQFDSGIGVLTGATLTLDSNRWQSVSVLATDGPNEGPNRNETTSGKGSSNAALTTTGISNTFSSLESTDTCTDHRRWPCNDGATNSALIQTVLNAAVPAGNLGSYVGTGNIQVTLSAPQLSAQQETALFSGNESTTNTLNWSGTVSLIYDYLLHALPSFGGLNALSLAPDMRQITLDFGTVAMGAEAMLDFSLNNAAGSRTGLDLDSISGSGDTDRFSSDLDLFSNLLAGNSLGFLAALDTSSAGVFEADYLLGLSDADMGVSSSLQNYWLNLRMTGTVVEESAPSLLNVTLFSTVPEPGTLALQGLGLLGLLALQRRRLVAQASRNART